MVVIAVLAVLVLVAILMRRTLHAPASEGLVAPAGAVAP
jgi:hypothetical protein